VPVLSVRQIAATKAYTISRRGVYKDYLDLYFILSEQHAPVVGIIDIIAFRVGEGVASSHGDSSGSSSASCTIWPRRVCG